MKSRHTPRVTVITPSLNQGDYLERAICSVLDQGYDNLEYFVIDGGSSDNSRQIIRYYESELAGSVSQADQGPADAVNQTLMRATGDIVTVLYADNLLLPGAVARIASVMTEDETAPDWVVGHCLRIDEYDEPLGAVYASAPRSLAGFLKHDSGYLPGASSFWRRSLFDRLGPFDARMRFAFDYEFACRLIAAGVKPHLVNETLACRREPALAGRAQRTIRMGLEYIQAARQYADDLSFPDRLALWRNCDRRQKIYALANSELHSEAARTVLLHDVALHPWWLTDEAVLTRLIRGAA